MGLGKTLIKMAVGGAILGSVVKGAVREAKKSNIGESRICRHCGQRFETGGGLCNSIHWSLGFSEPQPEERNRKGVLVCSDCAKKCKKCGKIYCPNHIKNHSCKK